MDLHSALWTHFGFTGFRPGQEPLIRAVCAGRDAVGLLPTGAGKSVTYMLPALLGIRPVLVVSPLISLMADQLARAQALGLGAAALHAGLDGSQRHRVLADFGRGRVDLLLVAPERLNQPAFSKLLRPGAVGLLAVDEAHCVVHWGFDFRPDYLALAGLGRRLEAPVLAVTATATPQVRAQLERVLELRDPLRVATSFDRPNLYWSIMKVRSNEERWQRLRSSLDHPGDALVYAPTRARVEALRHALARVGIEAEAYHAGLGAQERTRVQDRFLAGRVRVVVATNAFGMGVDKPDVRTVVHWAPPSSLEAWYQEAGRAGRDGAPARCVLLWHRDDFALHRQLAVSGTPHREVRRAAAARLRATHRLLRSRHCIRAQLLRYLGEVGGLSRRCGGCVRCTRRHRRRSL